MSVSEADATVLRQLAENGDNHTIPRPVMHFFFGGREQLYNVAERLDKPGWQEVELAKGKNDFRLVATKVTDLLEASILAMMKEIEEAVTGLNIDYDGWETSVEKPN